MLPHLERFWGPTGLNAAFGCFSSFQRHTGDGYQPRWRQRDESGETQRAGGRPRRHGFTVSTCYAAAAAGYGRHGSDASAVCYGSDRL